MPSLKKQILRFPFYLILITILVFTGFICPEPTFTALLTSNENNFTVLESYINAQMKTNKVPGLSLVIFNEQGILYSKGFGVKNARTGLPVNQDTIFEAASFSKSLTAYAALKLVERGQLKLDEPLNKHLKQAYLPEPFYANQITLRMVLTHTSGLSNDSDGRDRKVRFTPGDHFSYSGAGFRYLQQVIEDITTMPFAEFMDREIIQPLNMASSSFVFRNELFQKMANGHDAEVTLKTSPISKMMVNAAYSLLSTPTDMAKFNMEICQPTLLKPETVAEMLKPVVKWEEENNIYWGLGIGILQSPAGNFFWHWGNNYDFRNIMVTSIDSKAGVVIMTNSTTGLRLARRLVIKILNEYLLDGDHHLESGIFDFLD